MTPKDPKTITVAEGELQVALDQIARLVSVLRRSDPEWCEANGGEVVFDEEWDEVIAEAEEYLAELAAYNLLPPGETP
jgi:hypothetical protein